MIDMGGSLTTFLVLFPTALGISYIFFYIRRGVRVREWKRRQANKEV